MLQVMVKEASNKLDNLLDQVAHGEEMSLSALTGRRLSCCLCNANRNRCSAALAGWFISALTLTNLLKVFKNTTQ